MKFHKQIRFAAPVDEVYAMLVSPEFRERVAAEAGATSWDVQVTETPDGVRSLVQSTAPTTGLPGFARSVVGSQLSIRQEETYRGQAGTLNVTLPGKPGSLTGQITLAADGAETVQTVNAEVKVSIPLVGGKIEKLIGQVMGNLLKLQGRVGAAWLAGN
ncbi:DUF2505 domain-containing protein [Nocardioides sp. Bht2]|uniref:DUF2505 domain-containing protein n=1 Tax=Nocardioides sp. Bht2 TaxID=3392297 RepID=UPI0039B63A65